MEDWLCFLNKCLPYLDFLFFLYLSAVLKIWVLKDIVPKNINETLKYRNIWFYTSFCLLIWEYIFESMTNKTMVAVIKERQIVKLVKIFLTFSFTLWRWVSPIFIISYWLFSWLANWNLPDVFCSSILPSVGLNGSENTEGKGLQ